MPANFMTDATERFMIRVSDKQQPIAAVQFTLAAAIGVWYASFKYECRATSQLL